MASGMSFLLVFLLSVLAMPLPVGVPPMPEDPALLRVAPRDSIAYVEWFGAAEPDPDSRNGTEALVAEPQVQQMVEGVLDAIRGSIARENNGGAVGAELFDLAMLALRRPGCLFIGDLDFAGNRIDAGLVLSLGDDAQRAALTLRKMEGMLASSLPPGFAMEIEDPEPVDGVRFRTLPLPPGGPPVSWGVVDGYLVLAVGAQTPAQIVGGLRNVGTEGLNTSEVFQELHGQVRVARPCMRSFLSVERVLEMIPPAGIAALNPLGISDLRAFLSESGLEGDGFAARSMLATRGRSGLLKLLDGPPLQPADLAVVPGDSTFAYAMSIEPLEVYRGVWEIVESLEPGTQDQFQAQALGGIETVLGLRLEQDILAHLGDTLTVWNSPGQGGLLFTGLTVALSLDNPGAFQESFARLMAQARRGAPVKERSPSGRLSRNLYLEEMEYGDHRIYFLNAVGEEIPFAPAWCVTDTHLLFSLFPQMLKATIDRGEDVQTSLGSRGDLLGESTTAFSYADARQAFDVVYPLAHMLGALAVSEAQREGLDVDISLLPSASAIRPHLGTEISRFSATDRGLYFERTGTLPLADPLLGGIGAQMLLPVWFMSTSAAPVPIRIK